MNNANLFPGYKPKSLDNKYGVGEKAKITFATYNSNNNDGLNCQMWCCYPVDGLPDVFD